MMGAFFINTYCLIKNNYYLCVCNKDLEER